MKDKNTYSFKIDFVLPWVDGNDPKWLKEKNKYITYKGDSNINRYRDFNNLKYLFRGIEKYASWVNKIFFVTWGHIPKWLNTNNEKIRIVKHDEFIPKEYLPTFNSNVIELNLHRIQDLSEHFVLFNDDLFILKKIYPCDFFKNGLLRDMFVEYVKKDCSQRHITLRTNNLNIVNKYFNKKDFYKNNKNKIFNIIYGCNNLKNISSYKYSNFCDFKNNHLTQSFLKSTFIKIWNIEFEALNTSCLNKFRYSTDIGQSICRYFQLLSGNFSPYKSIGKYFIIKENNAKLKNVIHNRKYKIICINDASVSVDFEKTKNELNGILNEILPKIFSFEK